ncbi:uncharacterized protein Z518_06499 [Rhinocladiella mackenziei CBS 650.93]|uniref:Uncharacterized protein n=1 Tax=Rhinocladiella mackenziei CBS 650.93 TaxID=1442369 RepID=A0A0D2IAU2_9EURO|nr:uncharacterized protein Z518_06499 [Rhinocladiella mackenziei CBS 650.93]KIX02949.1 hypothetical protein Z518_06499 [Rhinocladiella mackenziei CBS 650.93]
MAPSPPATTDGSKTWSPSHLLDPSSAEIWSKIHAHLNANEFKAAITSAFELPAGDSFTYHASASVNLSQVEAAIHAGRANGLHAWYVEPVTPSETGDNEDKTVSIRNQPSLRISGYPPTNDIQAYISVFDPTKSVAHSLKSLSANAKKGSIRATVAGYLLSKRHLDPWITVPKLKISTPKPRPSTSRDRGGPDENNNETRMVPAPVQGHENPALDFWAYACHILDYAGPNGNTALVTLSHHMLPVYMHHFGCVAPSWESLQVIVKLASGRSVLDMGSGNGYWSLMLRRLGLNVIAVDSGQSRWRTTWIADTIVTDGIQYLRKRGGCPSVVLLLVYPIVGGGFTRKVLDAYTGNVVCVAGTQNGNGYTGFKDMMVDEYLMTQKQGWEKVCQVPLPSFAGKDDALFAFRRKPESDKS